MSYYAYVLKSETHSTRYIGSTSDISKRLQEHNAGKCRYTSGRKLWRLIYKEEFATFSEARGRERFLKSGKGREELDKFLEE